MNERVRMAYSRLPVENITCSRCKKKITTIVDLWLSTKQVFWCLVVGVISLTVVLGFLVCWAEAYKSWRHRCPKCKRTLYQSPT